MLSLRLCVTHRILHVPLWQFVPDVSFFLFGFVVRCVLAVLQCFTLFASKLWFVHCFFQKIWEGECYYLFMGGIGHTFAEPCSFRLQAATALAPTGLKRGLKRNIVTCSVRICIINRNCLVKAYFVVFLAHLSKYLWCFSYWDFEALPYSETTF